MSAIAVIAACLMVLRSQAFASNPDVAAWGVTFDLTITLPLLYWFFVVRGGKARPLTIVPVFLLGTLIATRLIPADQQQFVHQIKWLIVPVAELLLIVSVVRSGANGLVANVVRSEISMFYYAFFGWKQQPEPRERAFTVHERSGWGTILIGIFVLIAAEGVAMHLFLARWKPMAAWGWTGLDLWAVIWLLGDYHGLRLRRSWIDDDALHIRYGLRWTVTIPREQILSVDQIRNESEWKRKDVLKMAMLDEPRWLITLREPIVAQGMAGIRKTIRAVAILPDRDDWRLPW